MRAQFYTMRSTMRWWSYSLDFTVQDRFVAVSGWLHRVYWCGYLRWDGR